ncbi:MAG: hypothetical protein ACHP7D_11025 [Lysobacterales bacterium]
MNTIATGLLGLHGYPTQPLSWSGVFGVRAKRAVPKRPQPTGNATPGRRDAGSEASSRGHVYW